MFLSCTNFHEIKISQKPMMSHSGGITLNLCYKHVHYSKQTSTFAALTGIRLYLLTDSILKAVSRLARL